MAPIRDTSFALCRRCLTRANDLFAWRQNQLSGISMASTALDVIRTPLSNCVRPVPMGAGFFASVFRWGGPLSGVSPPRVTPWQGGSHPGDSRRVSVPSRDRPAEKRLSPIGDGPSGWARASCVARLARVRGAHRWRGKLHRRVRPLGVRPLGWLARWEVFLVGQTRAG